MVPLKQLQFLFLHQKIKILCSLCLTLFSYSKISPEIRDSGFQVTKVSDKIASAISFLESK